MWLSRDVKPDADEAVSLQDQAFVIDPLRDPRWPTLVEQHPAASVFHSRPWLHALRSTYGYEPIAVTTAPSSESLSNALVFCIVRSWLTGDRLVSLPFSDHCEPLVTQPGEFSVLISFMDRLRKTQRWKYMQIRSTNAALNMGSCLNQATRYWLHRLDLRPSLDDLYQTLHHDCIRRKIRRAEREGLAYEVGRSESLLKQFYGLVRLTRAGHGIPPQPIEWFQNLVACMGSNLCIRIASKEGRPIAGMLTLHHGKQVFYKYGASDPAATHFGGTAMLLWETIKQAKQDGAEVLDLGRSDLDHSGLITYKARWGAKPSLLNSWEDPVPTVSQRREGLTMRCAKGVFGFLPSMMQTLAGRLLYRHIG